MPQSSSLGPLLVLFIIDDVQHIVLNNDLAMSADDTSCSMHTGSLTDPIEAVSKDLHNIDN